MVFRILSLVLAISLTFGFTAPNQEKDMPLDMNEVFRRVSHHHSQPITSDLTGEFLIDTNIQYIPNLEDQAYPSVAFDGTNYLVVWREGKEFDENFKIFGTRVSQEGVMLDSARIAISVSACGPSQPTVAFDGTNYFVVWQDRRNFRRTSYDIYGARVSPEGIVLDPEGIAISTAWDCQRNPSITFGNDNYLVVWEDERDAANPDIYGARVSQAGVLLDTNGIAICTTSIGEMHSPSVAYDGYNFLVVWVNDRPGTNLWDIYGARVDKYGFVLDTNGFAISAETLWQEKPKVAFDGTNYLVVWDDFRFGIHYQNIFGARVSQSGVVLDTSGFAIATAPGVQTLGSLTFGVTSYFVVWEDDRYGIYGARVSPEGVVIDTVGIPIFAAPRDQYRPSIAFGNGKYLVAFENDVGGIYDYDIYCSRVTQAGVVLDTTGIALTQTKANDQLAPAVAFDGTNYLVVWEDERDYHIWGMRVGQTGTVVDPTGIAISRTPGGYPSVAFDGTNYLIVWHGRDNNTDDDIYGVRMNQEGIVLDTNGIAISTAPGDQRCPAVAFDGTNYFVVWGQAAIYGARVNQAGVVLDTNGICICSISGDYPSVIFDGINYFVVWQDGRSGSDDIYGARVTRDGVVLDTNGILIANEFDELWYPSVAFDGTNFFVVWQDYARGIYGARVNQSGEVIDTNGIAISISRAQYEPCVVFDGTEYLVVWYASRGRHFFDLFGARVSPSGTVIEEFPVSTQWGNQFTPALARGSGNQILITYIGWTWAVQGKTYSAYRTWGKFYPFAGTKAENPKTKMPKVELFEVYPNPARFVIHIRTPLSTKEIKIYDISGKLVKSLIPKNPQLTSNTYFIWDETDDAGQKLPAGVYLCHLKTSDGISETRELILLR